MSTSYSDSELRDACLVLFGPDITVSRAFFSYLQPEGVKAAFRRKARETHPDALIGSTALPTPGTEKFHQVTAAYQLLTSFVRQRKIPVAMPASPEPRRHTPATAPRRPRPPEERSSYYHGPLPARPLEIGRYLYYRGIVPYKALIEAIIWQRNQRPSVGRIARNWGWLSDSDVRTVLCSRSHTGYFGEKAVHHGFLTRYQLKILLAHQHSRQEKLGTFFVQNGYLTQTELDLFIREQQRHNAGTRIRSS